MYQFLSGAQMMACWIIGLFFIKFWKKTGERLFVIFGLAFWMMAVERIILVAFNMVNENQKHIYFIRLTAYIFILLGIIDKNRSKRKNLSKSL